VFETWHLGFLGLWGLGTAVIVAGSARQTVRFTRLLRRAAPADERTQEIARRAASLLAARHEPAVCIVDAAVTPMLCVRRRRPLVILPRALIHHLNSDEIQCVLMHEFAHYIRRDHWSNAFAFAVTALFWWHPVTWWSRRELRAAQELCCDALVLSSGAASRRCYAETLFKALEFTQPRRSLPAFASAFGKGPFLRRRFAMLANLKSGHRLPWWGWAPIVALAAVLPCVPVRGDQEPADAAQHAAHASNENLAPKTPEVWMLQEPSGTVWYLQMERFEGRIVEGSFGGGSGVIFDSYGPGELSETEAAMNSFGSLVGGPWGGFPAWIRAYRFDPDTNEFDGSWYTLSVDTETGDVVVREVIDADLAAEIRRKAPGLPVLLPPDAKVWRIVVDDVQRPSTQEAENPDNGDDSSDENEPPAEN
jgi:beta-lactamase regulating signal transducer with metallopeptidase domain